MKIMEIRVPEDGLNIFVNGVEYIPKPQASHSLPVVDWEIVAYKAPYFGNDDVVFTKNHRGGFEAIIKHPVERVVCEDESVLKRNATIHSVLRKGDGEIFSIGDKIDMDECGEKPIDAFLIGGKGKGCGHNENDLWLSTNKKKGYGALLQYALKIQPLPQRTKLFTTLDGKDIFEKTEPVVIVFRDFSMDKDYTAFDYLNFFTHDNSHKVFSIEEKAKEYVTQNKPLNLSMKEIASCITKHIIKTSTPFGNEPDRSHTTIDLNKLDELIKPKL